MTLTVLIFYDDAPVGIQVSDRGDAEEKIWTISKIVHVILEIAKPSKTDHVTIPPSKV